MPNNFQIPDLTKLCSEHRDLELRVNEHCHAVGLESRQWVEQQGLLVFKSTSNTSDSELEDALKKLEGTQIPLLASLWYPTCDFTQLRVVTDLLTLLLHEPSDYREGVMNEDVRRGAFDRYTYRRCLYRICC